MVVTHDVNEMSGQCENIRRTGLMAGKLPSVQLVNLLRDMKEIKDFKKLIKGVRSLKDRAVTDLRCLI